MATCASKIHSDDPVTVRRADLGLVLAGVLADVAVDDRRDRAALRERGVSTAGEIVDVEHSRFGPASFRVRFRPQDGEPKEAWLLTGSGQIGQAVQVVYDPADPGLAALAGTFATPDWTFFATYGLVVGLGGVHLSVRRGRWRRRVVAAMHGSVHVAPVRVELEVREGPLARRALLAVVRPVEQGSATPFEVLQVDVPRRRQPALAGSFEGQLMRTADAAVTVLHLRPRLLLMPRSPIERFEHSWQLDGLWVDTSTRA